MTARPRTLGPTYWHYQAAGNWLSGRNQGCHLSTGERWGGEHSGAWWNWVGVGDRKVKWGGDESLIHSQTTTLETIPVVDCFTLNIFKNRKCTCLKCTIK